jgi:hypothetical protein
MDNYADLKQLERHIANDVTPSRTTTDILANLKLLSETQILSERDSALGDIAKEEIKYLDTAMKAIRGNQILRDRFGTGLQAAMDVSVLLKDRFNKRVFDTVMDRALDAGGNVLDVHNYIDARNEPIAIAAPPGM